MLKELKNKTGLSELQLLGWGNLIGLLIGGLGAPVITLLYYGLFKDELDYKSTSQTKVLLNFYISTAIYSAISFILTFFLIGIILFPLVGLRSFVFTLLAIVKLIGNKEFDIPFVIELI